MAFGIDVKGITAKLEERFASMMVELQAIRGLLQEIKDLLAERLGPA